MGRPSRKNTPQYFDLYGIIIRENIHQVIVYKTPKVVVKSFILIFRTPYSRSKMSAFPCKTDPIGFETRWSFFNRNYHVVLQYCYNLLRQ